MCAFTYACPRVVDVGCGCSLLSLCACSCSSVSVCGVCWGVLLCHCSCVFIHVLFASVKLLQVSRVVFVCARLAVFVVTAHVIICAWCVTWFIWCVFSLDVVSQRRCL